MGTGRNSSHLQTTGRERGFNVQSGSIVNSPHAKEDVKNFIDKSIIQKVEIDIDSRNNQIKKRANSKNFVFG